MHNCTYEGSEHLLSKQEAVVWAVESKNRSANRASNLLKIGKLIFDPNGGFYINHTYIEYLILTRQWDILGTGSSPPLH